ncbi:MAG: OadG family protein [Ignavibacteria bacterium]|jgi:Na+-transporting methylmalonyl-CoA/oxaloacetate decarboxylase gamma subunit|nr:OadG family protein [Ignavibacteria bacterium]
METNLENALIISIIGFSAVMVCLAVFAAIISGINKLNLVVTESKKRKEAEALANPVVASGNDDEDAHIVPIILAAAAAALGQNIVVRKITFSPQNPNQSAWASMSRTQKFEAHNIQRRRVAYESK